MDSSQTTSSIPSEWPGATGAYKFSKKAVRPYWVEIVVISIVYGMIAGVLSAIFKSDVGSTITRNVIDNLISPIITLLFTYIWLAGVRGKTGPLDGIFDKILPFYFKMLLLQILSTLIVVVSFILFIVPFFFVAPRLALAPYFLLDKNLGPIEALRASWDATAGNVGKVYGIVGLNIAIFLLCITIIGIPFAIYFWLMYSAVFAVLYEYLQKKSPQAAKQ